ncbi:MAG: hypothetical protein AABZ78_07895, partial [Chloroflexota bacterium]
VASLKTTRLFQKLEEPCCLKRILKTEYVRRLESPEVSPADKRKLKMRYASINFSEEFSADVW